MTEIIDNYQEKYDELSLYTLQKGDPEFIHQYIVDAWAAQNADPNTKPITIYFALAGLYLHLKKNYSGKEVQDAHIEMASLKDKFANGWPTFPLPKTRGEITVDDVLKSAPGAERDLMINKWSESVWNVWKDSQSAVMAAVGLQLNV